MNDVVFESIRQCKQSVEKIKTTLLAEINNNMSAGNFDIPVSYKKLITFANNSAAFFDDFLNDDQNFANDKSEEKNEATPLKATVEPVDDNKIDYSEMSEMINNEKTAETPEPVAVEDAAEVTGEVKETSVEDTLAPIVDETPAEVPAKEVPVAEENPASISAEELKEEVTPLSDYDSDIEKAEEIDTPSGKATVIGADKVKIEEDTNPFNTINFNEKRIPKNNLIYESFQLNLTRGGSREKHEVFLYIAPLILTKNSSNVPIIVHAYSEGRQITASSYDKRGNGRSLVTIEINEFNLLCRGSFENGTFNAFVVTSGFSAAQGDTLEMVNKERGSNTINNEQSVGHVKFKEGDTLFEVFPISMTDNEYVTIAITEEFIDYAVTALDYGTARSKYLVNNVEKELIAHFEGDIFEAELI